MDPAPQYRLLVSTRFLAPMADVWRVFTDPSAIMASFPLWAPFRFSRPAEVQAALTDGAATLRIPARYGPLSWTAHFTLKAAGQAYTHVGETSLYPYFHHTLRLEPASDGTRLVEDVWFAPAACPGPAAQWTARTFQARHTRAARNLPADARTVGHLVLRAVFEHDTPPAIVRG